MNNVVTVDDIAAWRLPIAGFLCDFLLTGYASSLGILLNGLNDYFEISDEVLVITALLLSAITYIIMPAMEYVSKLIDVKTGVLISCLMMTLSNILMFFLPVTTVSVVILFGVCTGLSESFPRFIFSKLTTIAFNARKGAAVAVLRSGGLIGAMLIAPLYTFLIDFLGVRMAIFLIGAFFLNILVAVILMPSGVIDENGRLLTPMPRFQCWQCSCISREDNVPDVGLNEDNEMEPMRAIMHPLPVKLPFLLFVCTVCIIATTAVAVSAGVYVLFMADIGLPKYTIAAALSIKSGVSLFCLLFLGGFLYDKVSDRSKYFIFSIAMLVGFVGILPLLFPISNPTIVSFVHGITYGITFGLGVVGFYQMIFMITGPSYFGRALSIIQFLTGIVQICSSLGYAAMIRIFGSYRSLYFLFVGLFLAPGVLLIIAGFLFTRCSCSVQQRNPEEIPMDVIQEEEEESEGFIP